MLVLETETWLRQVEHLPELGVALVLSLLIGLERQFRGKEAGVRTHALVGLGAALFMVVSKFGFMDLISVANISIDPSRVAAQIVSGIGFLGAGIIVFRADAVRGLTTAAAVWLTAAVGMASGAGLFLVAAVATLGHFVVVFVGPLLRRLDRRSAAELEVEYLDGQGLLRDIVAEITRGNWNISGIRTSDEAEPGYVDVSISAHGIGAADELVKVLSDLDGVRTVDVRVSGRSRRRRPSSGRTGPGSAAALR